MYNLYWIPLVLFLLTSASHLDLFIDNDSELLLMDENVLLRPPNESPSETKYYVRSPYRWLGPRDTDSSSLQGEQHELDDDGPDFWDVVAWLGTQVGRGVRLICNAIVRLSKAIYVGVTYGWNEAKSQE